MNSKELQNETITSELLYDFHKLISDKSIDRKTIRIALDWILKEKDSDDKRCYLPTKQYLKSSDLQMSKYLGIISKYFTNEDKNLFMTSSEIIAFINKKEEIPDFNQVLFGKSLKNYFGQFKSKKIDGSVRKMYHVGIK